MEAFNYGICFLFLWNSSSLASRCTVNRTLIRDGLTFSGDEKKWQHLDTFCVPAEALDNVTHLQISNCAADRAVLITLLNVVPNLLSLTIWNVKYTWDGVTTTRANNPNIYDWNIKVGIDNSKFTVYALFQSLLLSTTSNNKSTGCFTLESYRWFEIEMKVGNRNFFLSNRKLQISNMEDTSFLGIFNQNCCIATLNISRSTLQSEAVNSNCVTSLTLHNNKYVNGAMQKIIGSYTKLSELSISTAIHQSLDINLLPRELESVETTGICLRWASGTIHPIVFERLSDLSMVDGDLNPGLIYAESLTWLHMRNIFLYNSSYQTLYKAFPEVIKLAIMCQNLPRKCITFEIDELPKTVGSLFLSGMNLSITGNLTFESIQSLHLGGSTETHFSLDYLSDYFPSLTTFKYSSSRILPVTSIAKLFRQQKLFKIGFDYPFGLTSEEETKYREFFQLEINVSLPTPFPRYREVVFSELFNKGRTWQEIEPEKGTGINYSPSEWSSTRLYQLFKGSNQNWISDETLDWFYRIYPMVLYTTCILGVIFNIFTIMVLCTKAFRSSTGNLLIALQTSDTILLLTSFFSIEEFQLLLKLNYEKSYLNQYLAYPLSKTAYMTTVYLTLLINFERYYVVSYPLKAKSVLTKKRSIKSILAVVTFGVIVNLPRWFEGISWEYKGSDQWWSAMKPPQLPNFPMYITLYHRWMWYTLMYAVPFTVIVILNIALWIKLYKSRVSRRASTSTTSGSDSSLTPILMTIVLVFLACNSVSALILWIFMANSDPDVVETLACCPIILNSSTNFLLYCFMGQKFRTELWKLLRMIPERIMCADKNRGNTHSTHVQ